MSGRPLSMASLAMVITTGCTSLKPDARIDEASDLVQKTVGHRPAWSVPWDEDSRAWDGTSVLELEPALATALRNNRELRADLEMIGQANADLVQAGLLQNPVINFMIMFPDGGGRAMLRGNGLPMQPLQDLWLIPARQEVAKAELQQAVVRGANRAVETAAEVKKVYARLQYTQRAIELVRDNMQVVQQSTELVRLRQSSGQATQVAVNLLEIRYLKLRSEQMGMEAEHRAAQRELLMLMGEAAATDQWKVRPIAESKTDVSEPAAESSLVTVAIEQRLDLKAAEWRVQSAEHSIDLMRREGWPDLALGLGFERSPAPRSNNQRFAGKLGNAAAQGISDGITGMQSPPPMVAPFSPKMREVKYTIGPMLEMEVPIFDWNQAKVARALHEHRQRVAEYEARFQEVTRMVREKLVMSRQAYDQICFYRESIMPAVERNLTLAQQAYVAGQEDLTVYLDVQEDLLMTRLKILTFFRDYLVTHAELEREVGGRLTTSVATSQPVTTHSADQP